jgi:peptidoglycan/xylan/chitin deacetylase (PgdA/CDA1 family)
MNTQGRISPFRADHNGIRTSAALAGRAVLQRADELIARFSPTCRGLLVFVFHTLFESEAEADSGIMHPHERATPEGLRRLFAYFREQGFSFVGADEIDRGLQPGGRYAHLTFDDGFANNLGLLDLLPGEGVHASVFPSANHVREQRAFWWNALYRERHRRGQSSLIVPETERLRRMTSPQVDSHLCAEFGPASLEPAGDLDRPLTVEELKLLGESPWVEIGNHTLDHAILTRCTEEEASAQIGGAQDWLAELLGRPPFFIAYPNGNFNANVTELARAEGLRLGVTVAPGANALPAGAAERMQLGRFRVVFDRHERARMRAVCSSVQLTSAARRLVVRND